MSSPPSVEVIRNSRLNKDSAMPSNMNIIDERAGSKTNTEPDIILK